MPIYRDGYIQYIRNYVGSKLIYLVYAVGVVFNEAGEVLVARRYEFDWWDLPGGAKELDESISACVVREIYEETGLNVAIDRAIGIYTHPEYMVQYPHGDWVQPWTVAFQCRVVGGAPQPDGRETLSIHFRPLDDLLPHPHRLFDHILRDVRQHPTGRLRYDVPFRASDARPFFPLLRAHIKRDPIILPGALVLIQNAHGHILVTKRAHIEPETWDIPGGFCDLGESASHTAIREIQEETNLTIAIHRAIGIYSDPALMYGEYTNGDQVYGVGVLFEARIVAGTLQADGTETTSVAFKSPDELLSQPHVRPQTRQIIHDLGQPEQAPFIH